VQGFLQVETTLIGKKLTLREISDLQHRKTSKEEIIKVPMKGIFFLFSFKIYLVKYMIQKFETSGVKSNDFTSLQS